MSDICANTASLTYGSSEKYLKRLAGITNMEDALKRLDKLTHEEARMAIAQNLKATRDVDDRVKGVGDAVRGVDARVANGVKAVIDGEQIVFSSSPTDG